MKEEGFFFFFFFLQERKSINIAVRSQRNNFRTRMIEYKLNLRFIFSVLLYVLREKKHHEMRVLIQNITDCDFQTKCISDNICGQAREKSK